MNHDIFGKSLSSSNKGKHHFFDDGNDFSLIDSRIDLGCGLITVGFLFSVGNSKDSPPQKKNSMNFRCFSHSAYNLGVALSQDAGIPLLRGGATPNL